MAKKKSLAWLNCSEEELELKIRAWVSENPELFQNSIVFLEGEMGSGKSTFARVLLSCLVNGFSSQGSPTFPLVQEYHSKIGETIYHIDLYRLKNEMELEDSGILHQIEQQDSLALIEWASLFPDAFSHWKNDSRMRFKKVVEIEIFENKNSPSSQYRDYKIYYQN
jgi:tRNA threonylcarbamoyladenosine biosynthesis protein TsaE